MTRPTRAAKSNKKSFKVAIIGSGWNGKEAAIALKKSGHRPFVFEGGKDGPAGTSTKYSCHAHPTGFHYNRLPEKYMKYFIENYSRFKTERAKYLKPNPNSIHGIVFADAKGRPSRTSPERFKERCKLDPTSRPIDMSEFNLKDFQEPIAINEERIINGDELKEQFRLDYLQARIPFYYDTPVTEVTRVQDGYLVRHGNMSSVFDKVVNATGFQKFLPENFKDNPFGLNVTYQPVVGLVYEDTKAHERDIFSLLLLDGSNPCLMPTATDNRYLLTHCGYTLLASCATPEEAWDVIDSVTTEFIRKKVQHNSEEDLLRYVNDFYERFKPIGFNGGVIAKPNTENEFRLGFAFECPDSIMTSRSRASNGIIHVFPGKIASSLRAADEVVQLVEGDSLVCKEGYKYPLDGMLDVASNEISKKPAQGSNLHYACNVNPYPELLQKKRKSNYLGNSSVLWKCTEERKSRNSDSDDERCSSKTSRLGRSLRSGSITDEIQHSLLEVKFHN